MNVPSPLKTAIKAQTAGTLMEVSYVLLMLPKTQLAKVGDIYLFLAFQYSCFLANQIGSVVV